MTILHCYRPMISLQLSEHHLFVIFTQVIREGEGSLIVVKAQTMACWRNQANTSRIWQSEVPQYMLIRASCIWLLLNFTFHSFYLYWSWFLELCTRTYIFCKCQFTCSDLYNISHMIYKIEIPVWIYIYLQNIDYIYEN